MDDTQHIRTLEPVSQHKLGMRRGERVPNNGAVKNKRNVPPRRGLFGFGSTRRTLAPPLAATVVKCCMKNDPADSLNNLIKLMVADSEIFVKSPFRELR
jgi:hypothetical protein